MEDVLITGGTVINPETGKTEKKDILCTEGKITYPDPDAVEKGIFEARILQKNTRLINASGCFVSPGFIDAHMHAYTKSELGLKPDLFAPANGVTTVIDAGSAGLDNFADFYKDEISRSVTDIKAAISPSLTGVTVGEREEDVDPKYGSYEALSPYFEKYGDSLIAIKQRVHAKVTGPYGLKSLEMSAVTAERLRKEGFRCRIMVHFGPMAEDLELKDVFDILKPGDVFTHMFRPNDCGIFDDKFKVLECVRNARKKGILFENGGARVHETFENIRRGINDNFKPDIISTDLAAGKLYYKPSGWLPLKMSYYLNSGMTIEEVIKSVTYTPALTYGLLSEAGSINEGSTADITVFKLEKKEWSVDDLYGGSINGETLIVPMATVKGGNIVYQHITLV